MNMTTTHAAFTKDLKALLNKYNAEIVLEDTSSSSSYDHDDEIVVEFRTIVGDPEDKITDYSELNLGKWIDGK